MNRLFRRFAVPPRDHTDAPQRQRLWLGLFLFMVFQAMNADEGDWYWYRFPASAMMLFITADYVQPRRLSLAGWLRVLGLALAALSVIFFFARATQSLLQLVS